MKKLFFVLLILSIIPSCNSFQKKDLIPIYVEPYYNSNPFKINVGEYSEWLKTNDCKELLKAVATIQSNIDKINIQTLFVLSNRLYDLKMKDEAVYWFYTASFRRNVFKQTVIENNSDPKALAQSFDAYKTLLGEYVNGYTLGDIDKTVNICKKVMAENVNMKSLSLAYPTLQFDENKLPDAIQKAVNDRAEFIKYIIENKEEIKESRKVNGIENKY